MRQCRHILAAVLIVAISACAYTEADRFGYQTADLIAWADDVEAAAPDPDPMAAERARVAQLRLNYNRAVLRGDEADMRQWLGELNAEKARWQSHGWGPR